MTAPAAGQQCPQRRQCVVGDQSGPDQFPQGRGDVLFGQLRGRGDGIGDVRQCPLGCPLGAATGYVFWIGRRQFQVGGTPVEGSKEADTATPIEPGRYTTTIDARNGTPELFAISKTPGSTLWASVTARPTHADEERQELAILATDSSGECEAEGSNYVTASEMRPVFVAETMMDARQPKTAACAEADTVLLGIAGEGATGKGGGWKAELNIVEEPPVEDVGGIPPAKRSLNHSYRSSWRGSDGAEKVIGGTSFNDAPTLSEGEYADTIVPGERLLYRVPAEFGQRVVADVYFPKTDPVTSKELPELTGDDRGLSMLGQMYGPGFGSLTRQDDEIGVVRTVQGLQDTAMALKSPEIRYLNRTTLNTYRASTSGYYYIEVDAQEDDGQTYTVPFQLRVRVEGEPSGAPADAEQHWIDPTAPMEQQPISDPTANSEPTSPTTQTASTDPAPPSGEQPDDQPDDGSGDVDATGNADTTGNAEAASDDGGGISGAAIAWGAGGVGLLAAGTLAVFLLRRYAS